MSNVPRGTKTRRDWPDLAAFVAVLASGVVLIVLGHQTAGSLTTICAALVGVYGAWRHWRLSALANGVPALIAPSARSWPLLPMPSLRGTVTPRPYQTRLSDLHSERGHAEVGSPRPG